MVIFLMMFLVIVFNTDSDDDDDDDGKKRRTVATAPSSAAARQEGVRERGFTRKETLYQQGFDTVFVFDSVFVFVLVFVFVFDPVLVFVFVFDPVFVFCQRAWTYTQGDFLSPGFWSGVQLATFPDTFLWLWGGWWWRSALVAKQIYGLVSVWRQNECT